MPANPNSALPSHLRNNAYFMNIMRNMQNRGKMLMEKRSKASREAYNAKRLIEKNNKMLRDLNTLPRNQSGVAGLKNRIAETRRRTLNQRNAAYKNLRNLNNDHKKMMKAEKIIKNYMNKYNRTGEENAIGLATMLRSLFNR